LCPAASALPAPLRRLRPRHQARTVPRLIHRSAAISLAAWPRTVVGPSLYGLLYRRHDWRGDPRLRRLFLLATFGWSAVFAVRAGVQAFLYREDLPEWLAVGKLLLGWPLTIAAVALTLAAVRRATRRSAAATP
jgi:hypothetical protein